MTEDQPVFFGDHTPTRAGTVERCADKDFDERDEFAIQRERKAAAKAAGK
jgi:hypothetical protein